MSEQGKHLDRVNFSRGYDVCIMAIDGTWRRSCQLNAISDNDAILTVEGSIQGLNLKEFFCCCRRPGLPIAAANWCASTARRWTSSSSRARSGSARAHRPAMTRTPDAAA